MKSLAILGVQLGRFVENQAAMANVRAERLHRRQV
jgi:hypothetical protein